MDEIEKAHIRVFDLFLQVFDEGRLTDSKGRTSDARNAIFILTSNILGDRQMGFRHGDIEKSRKMALEEVKKRFRPEFLNRIDEQIVFRPLNMADIKRILDQKLKRVSESLREKYGKELFLAEEAIELIALDGYSEEYGVRFLQRAIQKHVDIPLSRIILSGEISKWQGVSVEIQGDKVVLRPSNDTTNNKGQGL